MIHAKDALPFARRQGLEAWFRRVALDNGQPVGEGYSTLPPLPARAEHGRWLVDCPGCSGAELADISEPVFLCLSCGNAFAGHLPVRVKFPKKVREVEAILEKRPRENQNWSDKESMEDLVAENARRGVDA